MAGPGPWGHELPTSVFTRLRLKRLRCGQGIEVYQKDDSGEWGLLASVSTEDEAIEILTAAAVRLGFPERLL